MEERRRNPRFDPATETVGYFELKSEVPGHFPNRERFIIKNISLNGFNLITNFSPSLGLDYPIFVEYGDSPQEFKVEIVQSSIISFEGINSRFLNPGIVYSVGCEISELSEDQKETVIKIISKECRD